MNAEDAILELGNNIFITHIVIIKGTSYMSLQKIL